MHATVYCGVVLKIWNDFLKSVEPDIINIEFTFKVVSFYIKLQPVDI